MKKLVLVLLSICMFVSCVDSNRTKNVNTPPLCASSSIRAFTEIDDAITYKKISVIRSLEAAKIEYFDTIVSFDKPSLVVIPKQKDGAFGEFDKGDTYLYYLFIKDGDILKGARVLQLKDVSGCWKIWNFTNFPIDNELKAIYNNLSKEKNNIPEQTKASDNNNKKKEYARVTTIADGYDVQAVNLWSSTDGNTRKVVGSCSNNERVEVLFYSDPYVYVRKSNGVEGYFMREFLK